MFTEHLQHLESFIRKCQHLKKCSRLIVNVQPDQRNSKLFYKMARLYEFVWCEYNLLLLKKALLNLLL